MQQAHQVLLSPILMIPQYLIYTKYISVKQNKGIHKKRRKLMQLMKLEMYKLKTLIYT